MNMETLHTLEPKHIEQKSFYHKAKFKYTLIDGKQVGRTLYSYGTFIMTVDLNKKEIVELTDDESHYSNTTLNHIKEFLLQSDIEPMTKQEYLKLADELNRWD